ncbi:MAG TPA: acylneuraminate cytidylyltransferase family protein [Bdellovibrio sp.]|uniref:acylneuraminate cytidylyltransferase family protein n=1 Tax=Bdellovibrio sp. TaxID=28201 RepID=UPI002F136506
MKNNNKKICIIPARAGSKRIPGKNLVDLGGKPLIRWTVEQAIESNVFDSIVVSSDSEEILNASGDEAIIVKMKRAASLAGDYASTTDVILDVLLEMKLHSKEFDIVGLLQVTSPFRTKYNVIEAFNKFENAKAESLVSVVRVQENPFHMVSETRDGKYKLLISQDPSTYKRTQDVSPIYLLNGAIYISRTKSFLEEKTFFGEKMVIYEMSKEASLDIDTPEDLEVARGRFNK